MYFRSVKIKVFLTAIRRNRLLLLMFIFEWQMKQFAKRKDIYLT